MHSVMKQLNYKILFKKIHGERIIANMREGYSFLIFFSTFS